MTTRHLVDPELAPILDLFSSEEEITLETLPRIRAESAAMSMQ